MTGSSLQTIFDLKNAIRRAVPNKIWQAAKRMKRRVELRNIKARVPVTKEQLLGDFVALGLETGDVLFIHSSLRNLGFVEGGPDTVIDTLMEVVGPQGTLVFPTFTIAGTMSETLAKGDFIFDPATSPSTVGKITEVFRGRRGVRRSLHPTHSVAAWGRLAEELTATHLADGTNCGPSSPFGKLMEFDGKVVGLGITFGPVTFYHAYEDYYPEKFPGLYQEKPLKACIRLPEGDRKVSLTCHNPERTKRRIDKTPEIEAFFSQYFRTTGVAHTGQTGDSESWWLNAREMFDCVDKLYAQGVTIYSVPNPQGKKGAS